MERNTRRYPGLDVQTTQDAIGRMLYQNREARVPEPTIRMYIHCSSPAAFEAVLENMQGMDNLRLALASRDLRLTAGDIETFDYITSKLSAE